MTKRAAAADVWQGLLDTMQESSRRLRSIGELEQATALEKDALYLRGRALRHITGLAKEAANDVHLKGT